MCFSWKMVRNQFACMVILQSTRKCSNHCWNLNLNLVTSKDLFLIDVSSQQKFFIWVTPEPLFLKNVETQADKSSSKCLALSQHTLPPTLFGKCPNIINTSSSKSLVFGHPCQPPSFWKMSNHNPN